MKQISAFILAWAMLEIIAIIVFNFIHKYFKTARKSTNSSIIKGLLERLVIYVGLVAGIQSALTLFGAIKIGTRLKDSNQDKITNDYLLIGNFTSAISHRHC